MEGAKLLDRIWVVLKGSRTKYFLWIIAGVIAFFVEIILLSVSSNHEVFKETVVLSAVPAVLFWGISRSGKGKPFHFLKCVVCIWIGRIVLDVILYLSDGREVVRFIVSWQVMLTILLFCMRIIQLVYERVPDKELYFGYILIGITLAFNVAYIMRSFSSFSLASGLLQGIVRDRYVLEHGIAFLVVVAAAIYQYQKRLKCRIKNSGIAKKAYLFHAVKMTSVSFFLFVYPLYELFLSE